LKSRRIERRSAGSVLLGGSKGTRIAASYFGLASRPDSSGWMMAMSPSPSGSRTCWSQSKTRSTVGSTSRTKAVSPVA
jgi:hypothetical protein